MRVLVGDAAPTPNAPFGLVENQYSLLDRSDLVFIDAPDTGFSRIVGSGKPSDFFGVDPDVRAFGQFVQRYLTTFGRWNSPKFLFGESYGTPRSAMLVNSLQRQGVGINGVVLLSSVLDFSLDWDVNFTPTAIGGGDWAFPLYLPTEAASAWYHHALPGPQTTLDALLPQVENFAMHEYLNALAQGAKLSPSTYDDVVAKLHEYTGLSESYIRLSNLRDSVLAIHDRALPQQRRDARTVRRALYVVQPRSGQRSRRFRRRRIRRSTPPSWAAGTTTCARCSGYQTTLDLPAHHQRLPAVGLEAQRQCCRPTPRRISPRR